MPPTIGLVIRFTTSRSSLMTDPNTALPTSENYGIDAQYNLIEIVSNKSVMTGTTFSRVSYDIPGSIQRFAAAARSGTPRIGPAQEIAENIQTRLALFFVAGTWILVALRGKKSTLFSPGPIRVVPSSC